MVSALLSLAVVSMAGLAQARSELFQRRVNDECCPCPVSGSSGPQTPVTVTVTHPAPTSADTLTVYVTQGQPGPSEAAKETVTVNHTVTAPGTTITAPGTTVTAPGTTVYVGGSVPAGSSPSQPQTNLPSLEHGNPSANENKVPKPSVITHTVFLPNQSAQIPATNRISVTTVTATLPQDDIQQPEATGSRPSPNTPSPNNSNGSGSRNSQTPNGQAPNNQSQNIQTPNKEAFVQAPNHANNNQAPANQAPSIQTVTVSQSPDPKVQTVTVTQGTANTQPVESASVVTVTAAPNSQPVPLYIQYPEFYRTVTQTIHNGDTTNIEINMVNIINGHTICIVQGTNNPCGHNVVINNPGSPQTTAGPIPPQVAATGGSSSMITTTSCPTPQNSTSIATVYNTVTATITPSRGGNDTAGFWAARPTGADRLPRSPVHRVW
ncbi:unnamed protein product [Clonostachys chloroleuca]|uniref:Uncharacterized protein n=1 Tax=Clonostachys chloroleuca TaxID=1926264 RepID=A0AA35VUU2_9HYPO|nr:unnamed protein product [Clonostachys chloroleuca]